jgi:hypothetical protein
MDEKELSALRLLASPRFNLSSGCSLFAPVKMGRELLPVCQYIMVENEALVSSFIALFSPPIPLCRQQHLRRARLLMPSTACSITSLRENQSSKLLRDPKVERIPPTSHGEGHPESQSGKTSTAPA